MNLVIFKKLYVKFTLVLAKLFKFLKYFSFLPSPPQRKRSPTLCHHQYEHGGSLYIYAVQYPSSGFPHFAEMTVVLQFLSPIISLLFLTQAVAGGKFFLRFLQKRRFSHIGKKNYFFGFFVCS